MSEKSPTNPIGETAHLYPHQVGSTVTTDQLLQDFSTHPAAYHPGLLEPMKNIGVSIPELEADAVQALETDVDGHDWEEIAAATPLSPSHEAAHRVVGNTLDANYDALPPGLQRAVATTAELGMEAVETDTVAERKATVSNWQYNEAGELTETPIGGLTFMNLADTLLREGVDDDPKLQAIVDATIEAQRTRLEADLAKINAIPGSNPRLNAAKAQRQRSLGAMTSENPEARISAVNEVKNKLAEREKLTLEQEIAARIEADKFPWTMPEPQVAPDIMDAFRTVDEDVASQGIEPLPGDVFRIAPPMQDIAGATLYSPEDERLLLDNGIDLDVRPFDDPLKFTREELQKAGIFFINRVGGGEQPLFGMPIPDQESPDGVFNVADRSFLTLEEFEKVYRYQQENGYGLGDHDPADVQTDMLLFAMRPESRVPGARKGGGFGGRENKYGLVRSPFVDLGFQVNKGVETYVTDPDGNSRRMNTTTIHLATGHPDYPGVSEMFTPDQTASDQEYMSAGEFVRKYYLPPPTKQEALQSMKYGSPTARERAWVSAWPEDRN